MFEYGDITPYERKFLSCLKSKPGLYLGTTNLTRFQMFAYGYSHAMHTMKATKQHNLLPEGLHEFAALKYLGHTETSLGWCELILLNEPDEKKAFWIFFDLLDEYLIDLGYEPLPIWNNETDGYLPELP